MKRCPFCSANIQGTKHLYICDNSPDYFRNMSKSERKIEAIKLLWPELTKEKLHHLYINLEYSLPTLLKDFGISYKSSIALLDHFHIPKRTRQNCITESARNRYKKSIMDKFGVINPSQAKEIKEKKQKTFLSHYGVDNIFKHDIFKKKINGILLDKYGVKRLTNPSQYKETCLKRYGVEHISQSAILQAAKEQKNLEKYGCKYPLGNPTIIGKIRRTCVEKYGFRYACQSELVKSKISQRVKESWDRLTDDQRQYRLEKIFGGIKNQAFRSKLEFRVENILAQWRNENGITFRTTYFISKYSYDFLVDGHIIIEVQGDYWHANPLHYKPDDILYYPNKKIMAKEVWAKDDIKKQKAIDKGFQIVYIWEHEMKDMTDEELEVLISQRIFQNENSSNKEY